ncbi:MAG: hypothetical protein K8L99_09870 [Anaerolineae bacterium]|nr:hypothetical protein [Anaerolineae bacterium]
MQLSAVTDIIRAARSGPSISTWPGYRISDIPFAVYDDEHVSYIGHPNSPDTRPDNLMAATSVPINDVETAIIPVNQCRDEQSILPLAYHEGFHVFQHHHFAPMQADMFMAMAFYPDLDVEYRTLCRLEVEVLEHDHWSAAQKLSWLGQLTSLRRAQLSRHDSLLGYERFLERNEGTASFVEQKARKALFDIDPTLDNVGVGWSRFYKVGAALCWLLEEVVPNWTTRLESGASPGDLAVENQDLSIDLDRLNYKALRDAEEAALEHLQAEIAPDLKLFEQPGILRIRYKNPGQVYRAFNPSTLISLGDGRVLHRSFFKLLLPGRGTFTVNQMPVIDHVMDGEIIFGRVPIDFYDGKLQANTAGVEIELKGIDETAENTFAVRSV